MVTSLTPPENCHKFLPAVYKYAEAYLVGAHTSVIRNRHMNSLDEQCEVTQDKCDAVIRNYLKHVPSFLGDGTKVITVLEYLAFAANDYRQTMPRLDPISDAIIVDFINYVGASNGVDYAMYTRDL